MDDPTILKCHEFYDDLAEFTKDPLLDACASQSKRLFQALSALEDTSRRLRRIAIHMSTEAQFPNSAAKRCGDMKDENVEAFGINIDEYKLCCEDMNTRLLSHGEKAKQAFLKTTEYLNTHTESIIKHIQDVNDSLKNDDEFNDAVDANYKNMDELKHNVAELCGVSLMSLITSNGHGSTPGATGAGTSSSSSARSSPMVDVMDLAHSGSQLEAGEGEDHSQGEDHGQSENEIYLDVENDDIEEDVVLTARRRNSTGSSNSSSSGTRTGTNRSTRHSLSGDTAATATAIAAKSRASKRTRTSAEFTKMSATDEQLRDAGILSDISPRSLPRWPAASANASDNDDDDDGAISHDEENDSYRGSSESDVDAAGEPFADRARSGVRKSRGSSVGSGSSRMNIPKLHTSASSSSSARKQSGRTKGKTAAAIATAHDEQEITRTGGGSQEAEWIENPRPNSSSSSNSSRASAKRSKGNENDKDNINRQEGNEEVKERERERERDSKLKSLATNWDGTEGIDSTDPGTGVISHSRRGKYTAGSGPFTTVSDSMGIPAAIVPTLDALMEAVHNKEEEEEVVVGIRSTTTNAPMAAFLPSHHQDKIAASAAPLGRFHNAISITTSTNTNASTSTNTNASASTSTSSGGGGKSMMRKPVNAYSGNTFGSRAGDRDRDRGRGCNITTSSSSGDSLQNLTYQQQQQKEEEEEEEEKLQYERKFEEEREREQEQEHEEETMTQEQSSETEQRYGQKHGKDGASVKSSVDVMDLTES